MTPVRLRLLCALAGLVVSCGGPISDFPQNSTGGNDDHDPSVGDGDGDGDGEADDGGDGDGDDGEVIGDDETDGDAPDDGDSESDAGTDPGTDAGEPGDDAGVPTCTHASDGRMEGLCTGVYCQTSESDLTSGAAPGGACSDAAELTLVCDGAPSRVVAACTQQSVLADGLAAAVKTCAEDDTSLTNLGSDCLDCYVTESLCSLEHCLDVCLSADGEACETCRVSNCADAFYTCSGLPAP